jgi:CHAD domain-containing protein
MIGPDDPARVLLTEVLLELLSAVREGAARVRESGRSDGEESHLSRDDEAVHDFRVALRRLRTLLRPARRVYGNKRVRAVAEALRCFAQATGALRDEEVLSETLGALSLPPLAREELLRWMTQRARREQAYRAKVVALLQDRTGKAKASEPSLSASLGRLTKLLHRKKARSISAGELAQRALAGALDGVLERASVDPADGAAMHELRIRYKRLRYTAELFAPVLGEGVAEVARVATRMQRRLGDLHDLDEAIERIERARTIDASTRVAVLAALGASRTAVGDRAGRDLLEASRVLLQRREGELGAQAPAATGAVDVGSRETGGGD